MGNVSSVGNPLSIINIQNPQQSGLDCIGYQYNKVFNVYKAIFLLFITVILLLVIFKKIYIHSR